MNKKAHIRPLPNLYGPLPNLYETREGIAKISKELLGILEEIQSSRRHGHISGIRARPNDVKFAALEALQECARRLIPPPDELVKLVGQLLKLGDENRRRDRVRFPKQKAAKIAAQTGLKGRALAREMRRLGLPVSDRSVARHFAPRKT